MPKIQFAKFAVLVADPSDHMTTIIASMLRAIGIKDIVTTTSTREMRGALAIRQYQALVIDSDLKSDDAVEQVRALRADETAINRLLPVVMMSSLPDVARIAAARDAGVTEFLRKPFAASHLLTRLLSIEANPRAFIATDAYAGPDRRRRVGPYGGDDRRTRP